MPWPDGWVHDALLENARSIVRWEGLTASFLRTISTRSPFLGDTLRKSIMQENLTIPIVATHDPKWSGFRECKLQLNDVGYLPEDQIWLPLLGEKSPKDLFFAWRASTWIRTGALPKTIQWERRPHIESLPIFPAAVDDVSILAPTSSIPHTDDEGPFQERDHLVIDASDVLRATLRPFRTVREVIGRVQAYSPLGFELDLDNITEHQLEELRLLDGGAFAHAAAKCIRAWIRLWLSAHT
jgi:hypothetical protein